MSKRNKIPENIATDVQFRSDRTCCICRIPNLNVQIHHIDEDRSNNSIDNLAILCLECHSKTQITGGFVRKLSPDLVSIYNNTWRDMVKNKLVPNGEWIEYKKEVYLEINLACYYWKNQYIYLDLNIIAKKNGLEHFDIWEKLEKLERIYSDNEWKKYLPLFDDHIKYLITKFQNIIMIYSDAISPEIKTLLIRTIRQLETERFVYLNFQNIFDQDDQAFNMRFSEVIKFLSILSRKMSETVNDD